MKKPTFIKKILVAALLFTVITATASAGAWERNWTDTDNNDEQFVNAEVLILKDGKFVRDTDFDHISIPLTFKNNKAKKLKKLPRLTIGEDNYIHAFIAYSTAEYEGTTYASVTTIVCVPNSSLAPVNWIPNKFENRTPSGIGDVNEDPRFNLYNLMTTNDTGESVRLLPYHKNGKNSDKPWGDYNLWVYKDYKKAYPLTQLKKIFKAHSENKVKAFSITLNEDKIRDKGYSYPTTIAEDSITVSVDDDMQLKVDFIDTTAGAIDNAVKYDYTIEKLSYGIYWKEIANGSAKGSSLPRDENQTIHIKENLKADKKLRITLKANWGNLYSSNIPVDSVTSGFASIAGTVTGRDDDEDEDPHNFDDLILNNQ